MKKNLYAVIGNPIDHSLSPIMHQLFAKQTQQNICYEKIFSPVADFESEVEKFFLQGGAGLNVTLPFKNRAFLLAQDHDVFAQQALAVNTLVLKNNKYFGFNTDGLGLINDIKNNIGYDLCDKNILLIGAGGAARGVIYPLFQQKIKRLLVANRTLSNAKQLLNDLQLPFEICDFESVPTDPFDVIINASSMSLNNLLPPLVARNVTTQTLCYDMFYRAEETAFMSWCKRQGAGEVFDGLGMLVEQGAIAFQLWRGVMPNTQWVLGKLREFI